MGALERSHPRPGLWRLVGVASMLGLFLPGCVAFNVRIRTVVDRRNACLRQIDYSGPAWEQFLLPTSGAWEVSRRDSGATARGLFRNPNEVGTDLVFDATPQVADADWLTFATEKATAEGKAQALRLTNRVSFKRSFLFVMYRYRYREELDAHRIPDFLRFHYLQRGIPPGAEADSVALVREGIRALTRAFADCRLTCAVRLPGTISSTNADWVEEEIAVWEVSPLEFREGMARKVMEVTSHRYLWANIVLLCLVVGAGITRGAVVAVRRHGQRHRDPLWRIR